LLIFAAAVARNRNRESFIDWGWGTAENLGACRNDSTVVSQHRKRVNTSRRMYSIQSLTQQRCRGNRNWDWNNPLVEKTRQPGNDLTHSDWRWPSNIGFHVIHGPQGRCDRIRNVIG
jgi:hypothetical protein